MTAKRKAARLRLIKLVYRARIGRVKQLREVAQEMDSVSLVRGEEI